MHVFNDFCYNVMQLSDPQPQLTNQKAPKELKEEPNRKEEEEEVWQSSMTLHTMSWTLIGDKSK